MADKQKKLTPKQEKYVQGLFAGLSQREAYKQAYSCNNWKDNSIDREASVLASKPKIFQRLKELQDEYQERNMVTKERVLQEYARLGFFDPRKLFNADGSPREITDLDDDTAAVVAGLDVSEIYEGHGENREFVGYFKKYKLADKKGALDSMARHLGMFVDKAQIKVTHEFEDMSDEELIRSIQRMEGELKRDGDKSQR